MKPINLFYGVPENDRWFKYDRYPRRLIRRIVRGKQRPVGVSMIPINLVKGLDKLGIPYRFNDYDYIRKHPDEIACIIGMPFLLFNKPWKNPIILGAAIYSHPIECPELLSEYPNVRRVLVPGEWMRKMFEPYYGGKVSAWPVGTDNNLWAPSIKREPTFDFLLYDKIVWEREKYQRELIDPICEILAKHHLSYEFIKYGAYKPGDLVTLWFNSSNLPIVVIVEMGGAGGC